MATEDAIDPETFDWPTPVHKMLFEMGEAFTSGRHGIWSDGTTLRRTSDQAEGDSDDSESHGE